MDLAVVISAIVLGLSVLASLAKFLDWFLHSDPRSMVRTSRWMLVLLLLAGIPLLVYAVAREQWPLAMLVGAGLLAIASFLRWRSLLVPLRAAFAALRPRRRPQPFDMKVWPEDDEAEQVRRAAALLEAYVRRSAPRIEAARVEAPRLEALPAPRGARGLTREEALAVLGLSDPADEAAIRAAHQRLLRLVHPDLGGSPGLAACVHEARDVLLGSTVKRLSVV